MSSDPVLIYSGAVARQAAEWAMLDIPGARSIDLALWDRHDPAFEIAEHGVAAVLLSNASTRGVQEIADVLRARRVRWTSVHFNPTFLRIGPVVGPTGTCYACGTKRYFSAPGSPGLARVEQLSQQDGGANTEVHGHWAMTIELAVAEMLRQIGDPHLTAGFIRKVDLLDFSVTDTVALAVHGCGCGMPDEENAGTRFHAPLKHDLSYLFETTANG